MPVQTGPGANPASNTMGTGFMLPGGKAAGRSPNHAPPSNAEVKERVELHLHYSSRSSWPVPGAKLAFYYLLNNDSLNYRNDSSLAAFHVELITFISLTEGTVAPCQVYLAAIV
jgi:hypothetical protein